MQWLGIRVLILKKGRDRGSVSLVSAFYGQKECRKVIFGMDAAGINLFSSSKSCKFGVQGKLMTPDTNTNG